MHYYILNCCRMPTATMYLLHCKNRVDLCKGCCCLSSQNPMEYYPRLHVKELETQGTFETCPSSQPSAESTEQALKIRDPTNHVPAHYTLCLLHGCVLHSYLSSKRVRKREQGRRRRCWRQQDTFAGNPWNFTICVPWKQWLHSAH